MKPYGCDSSRQARSDVNNPDAGDAALYGSPSRAGTSPKARRWGRRYLHKAGRREGKAAVAASEKD